MRKPKCTPMLASSHPKVGPKMRDAQGSQNITWLEPPTIFYNARNGPQHTALLGESAGRTPERDAQTCKCVEPLQKSCSSCCRDVQPEQEVLCAPAPSALNRYAAMACRNKQPATLCMAVGSQEEIVSVNIAPVRQLGNNREHS